MAVKTFHHYGIEVTKQVIDTKFTEQLQKNKISYQELPLINHQVVVYKKEEVTRYALVTPLFRLNDYAEAIYITNNPPVDGDWDELKLDIDGQELGEEPKKMKSRLNVLITKALKEFGEKKEQENVFSNGVPKVTGESKEEMEYIKMYLIKKGYDIETIPHINISDVDPEYIKRIVEA